MAKSNGVGGAPPPRLVTLQSITPAANFGVRKGLDLSDKISDRQVLSCHLQTQYAATMTKYTAAL